MNILETKISEFKQSYDHRNEFYSSALDFLMKRIRSIDGIELFSFRVLSPEVVRVFTDKK